MRRLLPYLGFLPLLLLVAVRLFAQQEATPGWDPVETGPDELTMILGVMAWSVFWGSVVGVAGPWRTRLHNLRVTKIYPL